MRQLILFRHAKTEPFSETGSDETRQLTERGHTDAQGSEAGNLALSRSRAEAVLTALIAANVPPGHLIAKGYGEARPIADNATAVGRALNRRIEFTLIEDAE